MDIKNKSNPYKDIIDRTSGAIIIGCALLIIAVVTLSVKSFSGISFILIACLGVAGIFAFFAGITDYYRLARSGQYISLLLSRDDISFEELATITDNSAKTVKNDLLHMAKGNALSDIRITNIGIEKITRVKVEEPKENNIISETESKIKEGREFIKRISDANDKLVGKVITDRLTRLESLTEQIIGYVERHPEKLSEIKPLMNKHLPMTVSLIESYEELNAITIDSPGITATKDDIHRAIETINRALENLLDDLLQSMAVDVSSDIEVLKTVLSQDGLMDKNTFGLKRKRHDAKKT